MSRNKVSSVDDSPPEENQYSRSHSHTHDILPLLCYPFSMQAATKIANLSHVKETTVVSANASSASNPRRIAWPGGKIVSNKHEALLKFYERKKARGLPVTREVEDAVIGLSSERLFPPSNNNKRARHHSEEFILTTSGRQVGPKVVTIDLTTSKTYATDDRQPNADSRNSNASNSGKSSKKNSKRQPRRMTMPVDQVAQKKNKRPKVAPCVSLEKKLEMSLDDLMRKK